MVVAITNQHEIVNSINDNNVDVDYYISMGGTAYNSLGNIVRGGRVQSQGFADVYYELAERFSQLVVVLNQVSNWMVSAQASDIELLKLYSRWLRTRNPKIHKLLLEKGLLTSLDLPPDDGRGS